MNQSDIRNQIIESFQTFRKEASHTSCESVCPFMKECRWLYKHSTITLCETITGRHFRASFSGESEITYDPKQLNLFDQ